MAKKKKARVSSVDANRDHEQVDSVNSIAEERENGQLLLQAAANGDAKSIELLLGDDQLDPNLKDIQGCTPLLSAVLGKPETPERWGRPKQMHDTTAEFLLADQRVNPNCQDRDGRTPLSHAAERGHTSLVEQLLKHKNIDPNCQDVNGQTPLSHAAERRDGSLMEQLLKHERIDPNYQDVNGQTPLSHAVERGRTRLVEQLLKHKKIDPNCQDVNGQTPLSHAVERGRTRLVEQLLKHKKIDPNCQDVNGQTPLSHAAERGYTSSIKQLLKHELIEPNRTDTVGLIPLSRAAAASQVEAVRILIKHRLVPESKDKTGRTTLSWAMKCFEQEQRSGSMSYQQCAILDLLLSLEDIDPNSRDEEGQIPLSWAIRYLPSECVLLPQAFMTLLDRSSGSLSSKDIYGRTLLSRAAESGQNAVVKQLLKKDIDPDMKDSDGRTPLSQAAAEGRVTEVSLLLQKRVDPDSRDDNDRTPLSWAAEKGQNTIIEMLLAKRADPDSMDHDLRTPLLHAVENNNTEAAKLLIKRDKSTLHVLAQGGALSRSQYLLANGCDVNARNIDGRTPLHVAAESGHADVAEELIYRKADLNCKDTDGQTPLTLALQGKHHDLVQLLLKNSARTTDIDSAQWLDVYDKGQPGVVVDLSQPSYGRQPLQFVESWQVSVLTKVGSGRRLLLFPDYGAWSRCPPCKVLYILLDQSEIFSGYKYYDSYVTVFIVGNFPVGKKPDVDRSSSLVDWDKQAIAWHIFPPSRPKDRSCWKSTEHFSTLSYGWIPVNGAEFFALFVRELKVKWLAFGTTAQKRLSQYRLDQLKARGNNSVELIDGLAEDAYELAQLRIDFKGQLQSARKFLVEYCGKYDDDSGRRTMRLEIDQFEVDVNEQFNQLDQTVKELLQFVFTWASINEARQSTSIATSIKRLSWITFIFLPAMFASTLFGMNVDILQSNPDWRWYLLFGGGFVALTVLVWLLAKYGQVRASHVQEPMSIVRMRTDC